MLNQSSILYKTLVIGVMVLFISVAVLPSQAIIINDNISTNNEFLLTPFTTRQIIEKPIDNINYIQNNLNRENELKNQPFEKIIQEKNHKNVKDYLGNSWIFYPTDDTFIKKFYPNENCGSFNFFKVGANGSGYSNEDALLKFDVSSIPSGTKIYAKLYLYYYNYNYDSARVEYSISRVTSDWDEDNVTWNKQPSYVFTPTDFLIIPNDPGVWLEFDVTEDIQNFIEGQFINYGWIISDDDSSYTNEIRDALFYSKENGNFIPYLVVKEPATFYVDDDNVNGPWDGTREHPFQNIQEGIDNCFCGDTVYVYNGTYRESVTIYEEYVNLIGASKKDTIIISEKEKWVVLVRTRYYGITISGFTISTDSNNDKGYAGITLDLDSYNNYVTDNIIVNNTVGILLWTGVEYNHILNNNISNYNSIGVYLLHLNKYNIISNNTIKDVDFGIYIGGTQSYNIVSYNNISNTETGIYLSTYLLNNNISNNLLKNNHYGIHARNIIYDISISKNTIIENEYGIFLVLGIIYGNISGNEIDSNTCGIYCSDSWDATEKLNIYNNNITNNKYEGGIFAGWIKNCEVFCNNFINNKRNAKFETYIGYRTKWYNNYWDDLKGSSYKIFGRMGLFIFHPFPWINFDWHPAKEPYDIGV